MQGFSILQEKENGVSPYFEQLFTVMQPKMKKVTFDTIASKLNDRFSIITNDCRNSTTASSSRSDIVSSFLIILHFYVL